MALKIFVARHGQNVDNAHGILNGRRDLPLTDVGRGQALDMAQAMLDAGMHFDAVYSSPLERAYETAQTVCDTLGMQHGPIIIEDLIEREFGVMTGKPQSDIVKMCAPDIIETDTVTYFLQPEGAETFPELMKRAERALKTVRDMQPDGTALLVCHGDLGKMLYAAETKQKWQYVLRNFHFGNGELIELDPDGTTKLIELEQHNL